MSEIQKAKSTTVDALEILEYKKSLKDQQGWINGLDEKTADCAIEALRDQAEREKGCEWCKSDIPMIFDTFTGMNGKPVNFCPNCGRDLRKPVEK